MGQRYKNMITFFLSKSAVGGKFSSFIIKLWTQALPIYFDFAKEGKNQNKTTTTKEDDNLF